MNCAIYHHSQTAAWLHGRSLTGSFKRMSVVNPHRLPENKRIAIDRAHTARNAVGTL
jgi:hypothetical protein